MTQAHHPVIVGGIDGSESSKHALRWAVLQAELTGAELVAVTTWHLPEMYGYVGRDSDVDAADLLVVGTRGHGGFEGMLLGSVSQHCVDNAACPVVVVPLRKP